MPDASVPSSFVKRYIRNIAISCPFTLTAGDSWSVAFAAVPYLYADASTRGTIASNSSGSYLTNIAGSTADMGPILMVFKHMRGNTLIATDYSFLPLDDISLADDSVATRVAGLGFEVANVTADLYKTGTCTVWRGNLPGSLDMLAYAASNIPSVVREVGTIPTEVATAANLSSAVTWPAAEGCYVTAPPANENRNYSWSKPNRCPMVLPLDDAGFVILPQTSGVTPAAGVSYTNVIPSRSSNIVPAGAVFAGLNAETRLSLTLHAVVEFAPGVSLEYQSLCSKTPEFDEHALRIVAQVFGRLPAGVMLKENASGDWFRRVVRGLAVLAPKIMPLLPGGSALQPIVDKVAEQVLKRVRPPQPRAPLPPIPAKPATKSQPKKK